MFSCKLTLLFISFHLHRYQAAESVKSESFLAGPACLELRQPQIHSLDELDPSTPTVLSFSLSDFYSLLDHFAYLDDLKIKTIENTVKVRSLESALLFLTPFDDEKNVYPEEKILDLKIKERLIGNFIAIPGQTSMFCANLHTSTLYIQNQCQAVIKNVAAEKNIEEVEIPTDPDIWFFTRARDGINFQNFDSQLIFLGAPSSLHE